MFIALTVKIRFLLINIYAKLIILFLKKTFIYCFVSKCLDLKQNFDWELSINIINTRIWIRYLENCMNGFQLSHDYDIKKNMKDDLYQYKRSIANIYTCK